MGSGWGVDVVLLLLIVSPTVTATAEAYDDDLLLDIDGFSENETDPIPPEPTTQPMMPLAILVC